MILTSWSYLLIHFGTEARGYSLAIFFTLLAWYALQQFEERRSWIWIVVFWSAVMLGFLAHLDFAVCFAGLVVWSLWRFTRNRQEWRQAVLDLFALFTVPVALMLVFYFVAIRGMEVASGPTYPLWPLVVKTASYTLGGPASGATAGIIALLAVAALCVVLICLMVDRDDRWIFYAVVIVAPLALIAIQRPEQLYLRYFMISVAASLLMLAAGYPALPRPGVAGLGLALMLLTIFVIGNAANTITLLRFGRGQYLAALRFIETHSVESQIVVTSDHDFRNAMLVNYYKRYLERPDSMRYTNGPTLKEGGADWLILHRFELTRPPDRVTDVYRNTYQLVRIYRYSDLSGWNWLFFHNLNRPLGPIQALLSQ